MIKYFCDRCGKDLAKERRIGYIVVNTKDKADGDLQGENEFEKAHFCQACTDEIAKFVRKAPELAPEKQDESDMNRKSAEKTEEADGGAGEETSGTKRQRLDIGKIMALKNAGWPVKEIAAEMHLTNLQVSQAIYNYNKKHAKKVEVS